MTTLLFSLLNPTLGRLKTTSKELYNIFTITPYVARLLHLQPSIQQSILRKMTSLSKPVGEPFIKILTILYKNIGSGIWIHNIIMLSWIIQEK